MQSHIPHFDQQTIDQLNPNNMRKTNVKKTNELRSPIYKPSKPNDLPEKSNERQNDLQMSALPSVWKLGEEYLPEANEDNDAPQHDIGILIRYTIS